MKRLFKHPLTQVCIGWLFLFTVWLVLPVDPPSVDAEAIGARHDIRC